jgi:hypothetical protein
MTSTTTRRQIPIFKTAANYTIGVHMAGAGYGLEELMQLLKDTLCSIHPTGTNTGAEGDPG